MEPEEMGKKRELEADDNKLNACKDWQKHGRCRDGDRCEFVHGDRPSKKRKQKKKKVCHSWLKDGTCQYGDNCIFAHEVDKEAQGKVDWADVETSMIPVVDPVGKEISRPRSYSARSFARFDDPNCKLRMMRHGNGIVVVSLGKDHPALKAKIESFSFLERFKDITVSGKKKQGSIQVDSENKVCVIKCVDGSEHEIRSPVHGKVIEVNEPLETDPGLLQRSGESFLYIFAPLPIKHFYKFQKVLEE